ncbi:uncharacterized protein B0P05DRAFT_565433 [Gilbertella persicaria]|uniref:uncharacterized protein n=1 Tax=Gilbertella persicaria TaxID=101096 RepID=UPI002220A409|nr:uncharacterized protein B0P05DRAFT_565433 [Gilbertella persicaria]KAI8047731.1 hypothetical protein B0P05DRAFT_565433 [Gilbertella persicaria]
MITSTTITTNTNNTTTDDIMTLSSMTPSSPTSIAETLSQMPELQLSINDLLHPTESAENLLESLSTEQLDIIEQAVIKIKERKLGSTQATKEDAYKNNDWNLSMVAQSLAEAISASNQESSNNSDDPQSVMDTTPTPTPSTPSSKSKLVQKTPNGSKASAKPPTTTAPSTSPFLSNHEPTTELREGVEWVSFVYSHHRTLRRYCIRTDLDKVDTSLLDEKFKKENCVYPRANLPRETYRGNRWSYETECNLLGWKLAYLNLEEIAGKRGLIQRAVDSYRNRYPSMRSRRVARQEKLLKGTLRKRKHREISNTNPDDEDQSNKSTKTQHEHTEKTPKTILIEEIGSTSKCRIRINIESVVLDAIDMAFRKNNCVFPRAILITPDMPNLSQRRLDEIKCNEIGWKLAWLNPRQLANKKNLLQRALDTYRNQFAPDLKPRKYASRVPPAPPAPKKEQVPKEANEETTQQQEKILLTAEALAEQQKEFTNESPAARRDSTAGQSCYSGTTVTLDFHDYCFSPPPEEDADMACEEDTTTTTTTTTTTLHDLSTAANSPIFPPTSAIFDELILATMSNGKDMLLGNSDSLLASGSTSSMDESTSSYQTTPSPQALFTLSEMYQQAFLMSSSSDGTPNDSLLDNSNTNKENMFLMTDETENSHVIDLITKFGTVDAGIGSFTNTSTTHTSTTDSSLLGQLF